MPRPRTGEVAPIPVISSSHGVKLTKSSLNGVRETDAPVSKTIGVSLRMLLLRKMQPGCSALSVVLKNIFLADVKGASRFHSDIILSYFCCTLTEPSIIELVLCSCRKSTSSQSLEIAESKFGEEMSSSSIVSSKQVSRGYVASTASSGTISGVLDLWSSSSFARIATDLFKSGRFNRLFVRGNVGPK